MIETNLNKNNHFFILTEDISYFFWKKTITINKWFSLLKDDNILEKFLNDIRIKNIFKIKKHKSDYNIFNKKNWFFIYWENIFFYNIFFLLLNLNKVKKYKSIYLLESDKLYKLDAKDVIINYWLLFSNLKSNHFNIIKNIIWKKYVLYINEKIYENKSYKIRLLFESKKYKKIKLDYKLNRINKLWNNFYLKNLNIYNLRNHTVSFKTWLDKPILKLKKIKNSQYIFKYLWIYNFCNKKIYKYKNNIWISWGCDLQSSYLSKIKAYVEWIERFDSWYFDYDISSNMKMKINYKKINEIIGANIFKKNDKLYSKKWYKLQTEWSNVKLTDEIIIPNDIFLYPYIDYSKYYANSNWIWAWRNYEEAFLSALFENSERDSLMLLWLNKLTPNIIKNSSLPTNLKNLINEIEIKYSWKIYLFDISFWKQLPHIFWFFKWNNIYEMWASCKLNIDDCIEKVITEILWNIDIDKEHKKLEIEDSISFHDHKDFYTDNDNFKYLDFLYTRNNTVLYEDINNNYKDKTIWEILSIFHKDIWWDFYIIDLTSNYSEKIWIKVVKVLSSKMLWIWFWKKSINQIPYKKERLKDKYILRYIKHKYNKNIPDYLHFFD